MRSLKWTASHAVWVNDLDAQHKEIFEALGNLDRFLAEPDPSKSVSDLAQSLTDSIADHFAHEERLMNAARYESIRWHKQLHRTATRRVRHLVRAMNSGSLEGGRV